MRQNFIPQDQAAEQWLTWRSGPYTIEYPPALDLGGTIHAAPLGEFIRHRGVPSGRALEVFSGPGFMGLHLLVEGLVAHIDFTDIQRSAVDCIDATVSRYGLADRCRTFCGDTLEAIPAGETYELVIGNPPWSFLAQDISTGESECDPGWRLHERFWREVRRILSPGARVILLEWKPFETTPSGSGRENWDVRPRPPADDFREMIAGAQLTCVEITPVSGSWAGLHAVVAQRSP